MKLENASDNVLQDFLTELWSNECDNLMSIVIIKKHSDLGIVLKLKIKNKMD